MYSQHFGLSQDPFSIAPDPRYLFMSERHREALAHLLFGVAGSHSAASGGGGGFVLLTGDIGTGKTTICRCFLEQIPAGCHVAYIFNPKLTVTELLQSICEEFHIAIPSASASASPTVKDYIDQLNAFLLHSHAAGESSVLIIDEAQNLQPDVLEQLRLLTNLETNARKLLQIVLIGQPELRSMLERADLEQLAQRVIARFHLDALTEGESAQYIAHRLSVAGHTGPSPFDRGALQRIHRLARGVPRRINLLCGRALLGAWATGLHRVNRGVVDKASVEVFGTDTAATRNTRWPIAATLVASLCLLVGAAFAGYALSNRRLGATMQSGAAPLPAASAVATAALPAPKASPASAPVAAASAPPTAAASAAVVATPPTQMPKMEALESVLPQLPQDIDLAWRELAAVWHLTGNLDNPCDAAQTQELQCYRASKLNMPLLRQLGRPGILTLQSDHAAPQYAVLVGMSEQHATLRTASGMHTVSLIALGRIWRGEFATLWHAPQGYNPSLRGGSTGAAIVELARQLALLDGVAPPPPTAVPPALDADLRERVKDFQRAHGLQADGQPGPITYMQLESATGAPHPQLLTESR